MLLPMIKELEIN